MVLERIVAFHQNRLTIWWQGMILAIFAFISFICTVAYIGVFESYAHQLGYYGVPADSVWMLVVSLLTLIGMGYFLFNQSAARTKEYRPTMIFLAMGIIFALMWFTAAVTMAAISAPVWGYYASVYHGYAISSVLSGLSAAVALADLFAWLSFIGFIFFSVSIYGVGSAAHVRSNSNQYPMQPSQQQNF